MMNQTVLDPKIKYIRDEGNPYLVDEIRVVVRGMQTCLDSFES